MELTPKVFRDVQFREKLRGGYHPEDVDEFLEQAALGLEALQEQLKQANERAQRAEHAASEASGTDETLKRMLLMAQRTADQAVKEARDEAERLLADSHAKADAILADADSRGRASYQTALDERRAAMESADTSLENAHREVAALRDWVEVQRKHLLGIMRDSQDLIEKAGLVGEPPTVTPLPGARARADQQVGGAGNQGATDGHGATNSHSEGDIAGPDDDAGVPAQGPAQGRAGTGEWDPHYLDNLGDRSGSPGAEPGPFGHGGPGRPGLAGPATGAQAEVAGEAEAAGQAEAAGYGGTDAGAGLAAGPGGGSGTSAFGGWQPSGSGGSGAQAHAVQAEQSSQADQTGEQPVLRDATGTAGQPGTDNTLAFDERALDTFFSEQDLGDDRGLGRFRRRQ